MVQAAALRAERLNHSVDTFASQLQHSALSLAAWIGNFQLLLETTE